MPIGDIIMAMSIAAAPGPGVDRAAIEAARWAAPWIFHDDGDVRVEDRFPRDIRWVMGAFQRGEHDDPVVQARAIPMMHWAVRSLANDDVRWNRHGACVFLNAAEDLAVPFLEMKMTTGDQQQRSWIARLLLQCRVVSDPRGAAECLVDNLRSGLPTSAGQHAFRTLARSCRLLELASPKLVRSLVDPDRQLRVNAAQLLCIQGGAGQSGRIIELLAPLLDDDGGHHSACSSMAAMGLLGDLAASPLRAWRDKRDAQGSMLTDHVLWVVAGPGTPHARQMTDRERSTITCNSLDPASDITMMTMMTWNGTRGRYEGDAECGPWWYYRIVWWDFERDTLAFIMRELDPALQAGTERVVRALLERTIAHLPRAFGEALQEEVRRLFEERLISDGLAPADPPWCRDRPGPSRGPWVFWGWD